MAKNGRSGNSQRFETACMIIFSLLVYHQFFGCSTKEGITTVVHSSTTLNHHHVIEDTDAHMATPTLRASNVVTANSVTAISNIDSHNIEESEQQQDSQNPNNEERERRMIKYKTTYQYATPEQDFQGPIADCGAAPDYDSFWKLDKYVHSCYDEDHIIYETFFKHSSLQTGNYVELGAFNGITASNSRFFDVCLGWKGLLLEGNPTNFNKTVEHRPRTHRMQVAPSCSAEYEAINKTITFAKAPSANSGLPTFAKTFADRPHIQVPCGPLGPILEDVFATSDNNKPHIHFFSLDVEGAENLVLKTLDFTKVQIDVMMIEVVNNECPRGTHCPGRDLIRETMQKAGYKGYKKLVRASDVYVHPKSEFQLSEEEGKQYDPLS